MRGPAAFATYVAAALVVGGFAVIFSAWNGAAALDQLGAQFPFLVSGGMVGLGFIVSGCALWGVQTSRQLGAQRAVEMQRLDLAFASVADVLVADVLQGPVAETPAARVVAGRSSYHDPSCHLVNDRGDLDTIARVDAAALGLAPCRVCKPA